MFIRFVSLLASLFPTAPELWFCTCLFLSACQQLGVSADLFSLTSFGLFIVNLWSSKLSNWNINLAVFSLFTSELNAARHKRDLVLQTIQNWLLLRRVQGQLGKPCLPLPVMKYSQMGLVREENKLLLSGNPPLQEYDIFTLHKILYCPLHN